VPGLTDLAVNGYGFLLGGLVLVPFAALAGGVGLRAGLSVPELAATAGLLIGLSAGPTAVAYTFYYRGLRGESASTAALLTLLEPLTAAVLGALFLGDRLGTVGIAGALILGAALVRAALGGRPRTQEQAILVREVVASKRLQDGAERP
jgi:DME family drug/metabolite transporter